MTFKCDLNLQPTWKKMFQMSFLLLKESNGGQIILKFMHKDKSGWTHACLHSRTMYIHWTDIVTTMSLSSQAGLTKKGGKPYMVMYPKSCIPTSSPRHYFLFYAYWWTSVQCTLQFLQEESPCGHDVTIQGISNLHRLCLILDSTFCQCCPCSDPYKWH